MNFDKEVFRIYNTDMVNKRNIDFNQDDVEITNEDMEITEPDLETVEAREKDIIHSLREKLKVCETERRNILEENQRGKADFLNARRRLEEERKRDKERATISHVEELIPLCDSFEVAMANKEQWEKVDTVWRKGIEGISAQLNNLLNSYQVKVLNPLGEAFNPHLHEAISITTVIDSNEHDMVVAVVQRGYSLTKQDGTLELIRPARVVIGVHETN